MSSEDKDKKVRKRKLKGSDFFSHALMVLLLISIAGVSAVGFTSYKTYQDMKGTTEIDTIYKNVLINDIDVGGLTKEQALTKLNEMYQPMYKDKTIEIVGGQEKVTFSFDEFDAHDDLSEAVDMAYAYARSGSVKSRYDKIVGLDTAPYKITYEPKYSYDNSTVYDRVAQYADLFYVEPVNATISRTNGVFSITNESYGKKLDVQATADGVNQLLEENQSGTVEAVTQAVDPMFFAQDLQDAQSLIGSYSTTFTAGENGRNTNIKNALSKINDYVLYPNEVFSTNEVFGEMSQRNGYRPAPVIVGGKLVDDIGGGVCQVSSTLYNTLLFAEMEIVERQNHSLKVGYVDYGFDATLAGDYIDLKFKNNTPLPVFVEAYISGNKVIVNLYGKEIHEPGRKLVFEKALVEKVEPGAEQIIETSSLAPGERSVRSSAKTGYKYNVFKLVYENDQLLSKELVNTSYYKPVRAEVLLGTGTAAPDEGLMIDETSEILDGADPVEQILNEAPPASSDVADPVSPPVAETPIETEAPIVVETPIEAETPVVEETPIVTQPEDDFGPIMPSE